MMSLPTILLKVLKFLVSCFIDLHFFLPLIVVYHVVKVTWEYRVCFLFCMILQFLDSDDICLDYLVIVLPTTISMLLHV